MNTSTLDLLLGAAIRFRKLSDDWNGCSKVYRENAKEEMQMKMKKKKKTPINFS